MTDSYERIRVLIVVYVLNVDNGVASFAMNYLRKTDRNKYIMDFVCYEEPDKPYADEVRSLGGEVIQLPPVNTPGKHLAACRAVFKRHRYQIVHDNALTKSVPLMLCAKQQKIPVRILHSHSASLGERYASRSFRKMVLDILKFSATDYASCSRAAGDLYFKKSPYQLIPNMVEESVFCFDKSRRYQIRKSMGVADRLVIGCVGRLTDEKNPFFALDVIKYLSEKRDDLVFWWIGTGALEQEVKKYVYSRGMDQIVSILGLRKDMADLYQAMDIFLLPSLFEGLPIAGIEAQAMGVPMVVSDTVTREMEFTDLVKYVSLQAPVREWAEAILEQAEKDSDRSLYSENLINSRFHSGLAARTLDEYYQRLLSVKMITIRHR